MKMIKKEMTQEEMSDFISSRENIAWKKLMKVESEYGCGSDVSAPYFDRWLALYRLCLDLNIDC